MTLQKVSLRSNVPSPRSHWSPQNRGQGDDDSGPAEREGPLPGAWTLVGRGRPCGLGCRRPGASRLCGLPAGRVTVTFPRSRPPTGDPHLGFLWSHPKSPGRGLGMDSGVCLAAEGTRVLGGSLTSPLLGGPEGNSSRMPTSLPVTTVPQRLPRLRGQCERAARPGQCTEGPPPLRGSPLPCQGQPVPSGHRLWEWQPLNTCPELKAGAAGGSQHTEHASGTPRTGRHPHILPLLRPPLGWWVSVEETDQGEGLQCQRPV